MQETIMIDVGIDLPGWIEGLSGTNNVCCCTQKAKSWGQMWEI